MRFASITAAVALVAGASAYSNSSVYVTEVLSSFVTYCSSATAITHNGETYSVTTPGPLTITNCPCTVTKPAITTVTTSCLSSAAVAPTAPYSNGTTAVYTPPAGTGAPSASATGPTATFTGAANKAYAASGAGLAAVFGLAAYAL